MSNVLTGVICFGILFMATAADCAEFEALPSVAVSEEFTDNVFATNKNRTSDYITRLLPALVLSYRASALTGDIGYVFDYRSYARKNHEDEVAHSLSAKGRLTAVENFMYLDVSDEYQRVSLDATRDVTRESLFVNQIDRNVATVSPFLMFHFGDRVMFKPGYRFIDTRYFSPTGVDKYSHTASLDVSYELSKVFSLTAAYSFVREESEAAYSRHQTLEGFRYEYADKSFLFAQGGYTWSEFDSGSELKNIIWNAGITHVFNVVTGTVTTGVRYNEDPLRNILQESFVSGSLDMRFQRGSLNVSSGYSEYILTSTDTLQTKKYGATVRGQYELSQGLNGSIGFSAEKYIQPLSDSYTRRFQVDTGLTYLLARQLTASLSYMYTGYYSPAIALDNKDINRAMLELKKAF